MEKLVFSKDFHSIFVYFSCLGNVCLDRKTITLQKIYSGELYPPCWRNDVNRYVWVC